EVFQVIFLSTNGCLHDHTQVKIPPVDLVNHAQVEIGHEIPQDHPVIIIDHAVIIDIVHSHGSHGLSGHSRHLRQFFLALNHTQHPVAVVGEHGFSFTKNPAHAPGVRH